MSSIRKFTAPFLAIALTCVTTDLHAQRSITEVGEACTNVYLVDSGNRFINSPTTYAEVSFAIDDSKFLVKGKLATVDWGAFTVCGKELKLRFRALAETRLAAGPIIRPFKKDYSLRLRDENMYFGLRGWGYKEIPGEDGKKAIAMINVRRGMVNPATGWEWIDRRELYYGKGSKCAAEKSDRCP